MRSVLDVNHLHQPTEAIAAATARLNLPAAETIDETMTRLIQRKREVVDAITDGRELPDGGLSDGDVRELRDGRPFRHLRAVATDPDADATLAGGAEKRRRRRGKQ